jgi:NAD(P)-dependent dehydrogenase (short-subunit alcohol dehydrogenase family)
MQSNRVALVTGANQGVGLQVAKELVANGLTVLVGSRSFGRGETAAKGIGPGAIPIQLDVTDRASIAAAAERIRKEFGRLDLLVNNAAISNTRKQQLGLSLKEYAKISLASNASLDEIGAVWGPTCSASSPSTRRCCRSCASRRTPASSTYRAGSAR